VYAKVGDGYQGWPEHAPFDKIIVTCSPEEVPPKLVEQLREGGRMLVPVGERYQQSLYLFTKQDGQLAKSALLPVLFVPMTGQAEDRRAQLPDAENPQIVNGGFEIAAARPGPAPAEPKPAPVEPDAPAKPDAETTARDPEVDRAPLDGWYYQRQLERIEGPDAPEGRHYVTFHNETPGRGAQALQGLAVDGRKIKELQVSLWVKAREARAGATAQQQPAIAITFYDDKRAEAGYAWVGPWRDSFDWQQTRETIRVPPKAREAIVRIGLAGATGEISFDDLRIEKIEP
jgi:protein-L-isoaspartate(D-aspartate) O-methyltransferase